MFHRCYECPALQTERDMYVSQEVRLAARAVGSQYREQFAHGIFPDPGASLPTGFPERACRVFWHNRPPDGLLEGQIFTDGSSSGSGALRRAGWAVVAVDGAGNLKAAAYGAVPSDVLPGQCARDGEDYAAAMAGQFTLDPLTLYFDCEGTIATINGPKQKARTRLEQASVFPRRGQGCQGQGSCDTARCGGGANFPLKRKGKRLCRHLRQKRGRYTQARFSCRQDSCCLCFPGQASGTLGGRSARFAQVQGVERHQGCCATFTGTAPRERDSSASGTRRFMRRQQVRFLTGFLPFFTHVSRKTVTSTLAHSEGNSLQLGRVFDAGGRALDNAIIFCAKCGAVYWERADDLCFQCSEFPGGRTSQLRKLRSGLFPNKRYSG